MGGKVQVEMPHKPVPLAAGYCAQGLGPAGVQVFVVPAMQEASLVRSEEVGLLHKCSQEAFDRPEGTHNAKCQQANPLWALQARGKSKEAVGQVGLSQNSAQKTPSFVGCL